MLVTLSWARWIQNHVTRNRPFARKYDLQDGVLKSPELFSCHIMKVCFFLKYNVV